MTSSPTSLSAVPIQQKTKKIPSAASAAMPPPAGSLPPWERHTRATECARLIPVTKRRRFMAKPCTPHLHSAGCAALRAKDCQCAGSRGKAPRLSLGGFKGGYSLRKESIPLCPAVALSAALSIQRSALQPPIPRKGGSQKGYSLRKESIPLCPAVALSAALCIQRSALQPPIPRKGGNQKGYPLRKESIPL